MGVQSSRVVKKEPDSLGSQPCPVAHQLQDLEQVVPLLSVKQTRIVGLNFQTAFRRPAKRLLCQSKQGKMKAWWKGMIRGMIHYQLKLLCGAGVLKLGCRLHSLGELKIPVLTLLPTPSSENLWEWAQTFVFLKTAH